jgi:hypothetical protein
MSKIIISYRRSDSEAMAGRIRDCLVDHYGDDAVYMDIESIPPGIDFREHINNAIHGADLFLAVVGPKWRGAKRGGGNRIKEEADPVRAELEAAMTGKIPVIPVLVDDAVMPQPGELPETLRNFSYHNAVSIDAGQDFHPHMERLIRKMDEILGPRTFTAALEPRTWIKVLQRLRPAVVVPTAVAACVVLLGVVWAVHSPTPQPSQPPGPGKKPGEDAPIGGTWNPPSGRSIWEVDKSRVYLLPKGGEREFYLLEPTQELLAQGARPGSLLFKGQKESGGYVGKLYVYSATCPVLSYDVRGSILNEDNTVELTGKAPRIDSATCKQLDTQDVKVVFNHTFEKTR